MYVGSLDKRQLVSIGLMLLFAFAAVFFIGYQYAYSKSVSYANEQITKITNEFKAEKGLIDNEFTFDVIDIPKSGG